MERREQEPGGGEEHYSQMTLEGMEHLSPPEITLERCVVTVQPTYSKKGKGYQWDCVVQALPDLFNQEQNEMYHLHATSYAKDAKKKRVQPGDVVLLKGIPSVQELPLQGGQTQRINHVQVSELTVLSRAPRHTITIFDAKNGK